MRLIDADAYAEEMRKRQDACGKWYEDAQRLGDESIVCQSRGALSVFAEAKLTLDKMPTVDAVPVVRCKECKYLSMTTIGMPYACWKGSDSLWGETGEHASHTVCRRIDNIDYYCADGERREVTE